jgi:hypothetical protein
MKYVIFEDTVSGLIQPVLFGEHTSHHCVKIDRAKPVSAGFFSLETGEMRVYGESDSLKLKAKDTDLDYIRRVLLNMGTLFFLNI